MGSGTGTATSGMCTCVCGAGGVRVRDNEPAYAVRTRVPYAHMHGDAVNEFFEGGDCESGSSPRTTPCTHQLCVRHYSSSYTDTWKSRVEYS